MNIFSAGLACEYHNLDKKKKVEEEENNVEIIWGLEHPMEPQDEDRPVKCPMPHSSCLIYVTKNEDEGKRETKLAESLVTKKNTVPVTVTDHDLPAHRALRKRHHTLTAGGDHILVITPSFPENPNASSF